MATQRKARVNTIDLKPGDIVISWIGDKILQSVSEPIMIQQKNWYWTAVTLHYIDGTSETAEYEGYVNILI